MRNIAFDYTKKKSNGGIKVLIIGILAIIVGSFMLDVYDQSKNPNNTDDSNTTDNGTPEVSGTEVKKCEGTDIEINKLIKGFGGNRKWFLKGDEFKKEEKTLTLTLNSDLDYLATQLPDKKVTLKYYVVDTSIIGEFEEVDGKYIAKIDTTTLPVGAYKYVAEVDFECGAVRTTEGSFYVSYPLYVTWTMDWEGNDVSDAYLSQMSAMSAQHNVPMTHFFNPRIYLSSVMSTSRSQYLTNWVINRQVKNGDDVGLHLHMYPDMIVASGAKVNTNAKRWGQNNMGVGYDVITSDYPEEDLLKMLSWSKSKFLENGLGMPVMYRAGGWYANMTTLNALEKSGFVLDTSGRTSYGLGENNLRGFWYLSSTTKPYKPNKFDQNSDEAPNMKLWEFPNNGGDSTGFDAETLIYRFKDNFNGKPLKEPQVLTYLSHPQYFYIDKPVMDKVFREVDKNLYSKDNGPVIYTTLGNAYQIWSSQYDE